jgi:hypothetical protein
MTQISHQEPFGIENQVAGDGRQLPVTSPKIAIVTIHQNK